MIDEASQSTHADAGPVERPVVPLVERLRSVCSGYDEWRVQSPEDGSYCMAYSWPETMSPEREAREWLADHKRRFADSQFAGYVVACVRVVPQKDLLLLEAADALDQARRDLDENEELRGRMADLLSRTAVALRGPEPPLTLWSWHDVPERAAAAVAAIDVMQRAAFMAADPERHNVELSGDQRRDHA